MQIIFFSVQPSSVNNALQRCLRIVAFSCRWIIFIAGERSICEFSGLFLQLVAGDWGKALWSFNQGFILTVVMVEMSWVVQPLPSFAVMWRRNPGSRYKVEPCVCWIQVGKGWCFSPVMSPVVFPVTHHVPFLFGLHWHVFCAFFCQWLELFLQPLLGDHDYIKH